VNVDSRKAETGEALCCSESEILAEFDRIYTRDDARKNGGLVAATGADIENAVRRLQMKSGGHGGDDVGLRNGLAAANRQRGVIVGAGLQFCGYEVMTWDLFHGAEDHRVEHAAAANLAFDHFRASGSESIAYDATWAARNLLAGIH
jgi:hypothetical protein